MRSASVTIAEETRDAKKAFDSVHSASGQMKTDSEKLCRQFGRFVVDTAGKV